MLGIRPSSWTTLSDWWRV